MSREALAKKIFCIGVDGMDPRLTRKYVDEGKMPNVKKLIERGSCRHDLAMRRYAHRHSADVDNLGNGRLSRYSRYHLLLSGNRGT